MESIEKVILTINGGSSSIKFSLYKNGEPLLLLLSGEIESIGTTRAKLNYKTNTEHNQNSIDISVADNDAAANYLIDWLEKTDYFNAIKAIGHRIVHGMKHTEPEEITPELLNELKQISAYDPEHLPGEIKLIEV